MSRMALVLILVVAVCVSGTTFAAGPDTKSPVIKLKIQKVRLQNGTFQDVIRVGPRGAGACKKPDPNEEICGGGVTFKWLDAERDRSLVIEFNDSALAQKCFAFDSGSPPIVLKFDKREENLSVRDRDDCPGKTVLFYTVSCKDAGDGDCGGIQAVDPGVIIESGGP